MFFQNGQGFLNQGLVRSVVLSHASRTFTNLPAADTESTVADRVVINLVPYSMVAFTFRVQTPGVTGRFKLQYSLDGSAFSDLSDFVSLAAAGQFQSAWVAIPGAARAIVSVRMVAYNGDTTEDPVVSSGVLMDLM